MVIALERFRKRLARNLLLLCLGLLFLLVGIVIATYEVVMHIPGSSITCGAPPPYLSPGAPWQAVFTAHIIYVGRIDPQYAMQSGHRFGPWAIAYVKHRYWGLPWWSSMIVVMAPGWFQEGETYFVDGRSAWLPYSKFLPIVYTPACNRTDPLSERVVDIRLLSQGPPENGVRIIGRTYRREPGHRPERGYEPAPGMRIEISGPSGSVYVSSDADAVYDLTGLPAGHYSIQIEHPDRRDNEEGGHDRSLSPGDVWARDVYSE